MAEVTIKGVNIQCVQGDITDQKGIEAVVNAANAQLLTGGGVAGAIHKAAGPDLEQESSKLAPLKPGQAVITDAYQLPNQYVIHCLGPVYGKDEPADELLADCYRNALKLADKKGISSIAFPSISTGAFGYPIEPAAKVAIETVVSSLNELSTVKSIVFVLFSESDQDVYEKALQQAHSDQS
ncbi:RNase III inhibitor [Aliidiomarina minuta]|uniref:RNase III inhibitor n=1 Tax=Aliidiomarina minuta TaxID=880057 RepID=A0A432W3M3_9GAMM|nr:macro domain-containing protein [Aliidiomarina minuta]RUO23937.1 RNase III inhibitor [Aliidiomarina minuta]